MATNRQLAESIISTYSRLRREGRGPFFAYGEMAELIGRGGQHRLLGAPLDIVRDICSERGLPDIATMVVSKASILNKTFTPTKLALEKYADWPNLKEEQQRAIDWNW